jgi:hypothetical protein
MAIGAVDKGFSDHLTVSSRYFSLTLGMTLESVWIQQRFSHVIGADLLAGEEGRLRRDRRVRRARGVGRQSQHR